MQSSCLRQIPLSEPNYYINRITPEVHFLKFLLGNIRYSESDQTVAVLRLSAMIMLQKSFYTAGQTFFWAADAIFE